MNKLFAICNRLKLLKVNFDENRFVKCKGVRYKWDIIVPEAKLLLTLYKPEMNKDKQFKSYCYELRDLGYTVIILPYKMIFRHAMQIEIFLEVSRKVPGLKWFTGTAKAFEDTMTEIKQVLQQSITTAEFIDTYDQETI